MRLLSKILLLALGAIAEPVLANNWTDSEIKAMPPFCAARLHREPAKYDYWKGVLGPDYLHTHHFCAGIGYINRYYSATTARAKAFNLNNAVGNLSYMVSNASPTYSLMPEVYLNRGLAYSLMKKDAAAITDLLKAIELDPQLPRAYMVTADYYTRLNRKDEALRLATEGLRHNPESAALQRLYLKLGGQLPYPEPIARQDQAPEVTTTDDGPAKSEPEVTQGPQPVRQAPVSPASDLAGTESEPATGAAPVEPKIGTPNNPWCRFCPPEPGK